MTNEMLEALISYTDLTSVRALNDLWWAISVVTCEANQGTALEIVKKAISIVGDYYATALRYHIFALEFLAKMMKMKSESLLNCITMQIQEVMIRLIVQFPDSSNLMAAVYRFIRAGIAWDKFTRKLVLFFVPILVIEGSSEVRTASAANAMVLLGELKTHRSFDKILDSSLREVGEFEEFYVSRLAPHNKIMEESYGGSFQKVVPRSPSSQFYPRVICV
jgi:predicted neutral ceramidase superfamily lipid hydrolase